MGDLQGHKSYRKGPSPPLSPFSAMNPHLSLTLTCCFAERPLLMSFGPTSDHGAKIRERAQPFRGFCEKKPLYAGLTL